MSPKPINNFHDALNEWNNGELKNVPTYLLDAIVKQRQDDLQRRKIENLADDRFSAYESAWAFCCRKGYEPDNNADALELWRDSDEYATDQEEQKGCDDSHADRERGNGSRLCAVWDFQHKSRLELQNLKIRTICQTK
jgi:hypothetical protein